jgi:carboxyl-terminal processing protease
MGVTTFGKGSVQSLQGISGGLGLKLTTSRYYTPKGTSIQLKGIDPDVTVEQITFDGEAIGKRFREQDYDNSLNNEKNSAASEKNKPTKTPAGEDEDVVVKRNNSDRFKNFEAGNLEKDYQLAQAYNKLTGKPVVVSTKAVITADASKAAPGNQK